MIGWLIRWFRERKRRRERNIFQFWDGKRDRSIDPLAAWFDLVEDEKFSLDAHPDQIDLGDREAIEIAAAAVRRVFSVPAFDKGGLTQQECLNLLVTFFNYVTTLKKSTDGFPISRSRTAESKSSAESITPPAADSTSAENVPSSESPPA